MPSGMITTKAAPTRSPAPKIAIKFMILYDVVSFVGRKPMRNVDKNIPTPSNITSKDLFIF